MGSPICEACWEKSTMHQDHKLSHICVSCRKNPIFTLWARWDSNRLIYKQVVWCSWNATVDVEHMELCFVSEIQDNCIYKRRVCTSNPTRNHGQKIVRGNNPRVRYAAEDWRMTQHSICQDEKLTPRPHSLFIEKKISRFFFFFGIKIVLFSRQEQYNVSNHTYSKWNK